MMSAGLVTLQFMLIGIVLLRFQPALAGGAFAILLLAGIAIGLWAVWAIRPGNFNIRPEPKAGGRLVTRGPYRWVRHPMYLAVLLIAAAFAVAGDAWQWLAWGALGMVLFAKTLREERLLALAHPGYADYRARTRAIVPFVL